MRPLTRPWLVLAIAVAVVALPTAASGALSAPSANTQTYQDSVGEDPTAPDITTIVASNDDAATISFRINIPNRAQYGSDIAVIMFVDSDANQATGDPESLGADFIIQLVQGEILLFKWDGTDFSLSATQASLSYSWAGGPTIRVNAADLNNTRRLNFDITAVSGIVFDPNTGALDCNNCKRDFAPTIGFYQYEVKIAKPTLVVKRVTAGKATAGKPFTVRMVAARSDTGANVQNGRVTCIGRVGNVRLRAKVARVVAGAATCTWQLPAASKGKRIQGSVAITFEGLRAAQSFTARIG